MRTPRAWLACPIALLAFLAAISSFGEEVPVPGGPSSIRRLFGLTADRPNAEFFLELHEMLLFGSPEDAGWTSVVARRRIVAFAEDLAEWRRNFGDAAALSPDAWSDCERAIDWLGFDVRGTGKSFEARRRSDALSIRRQSFLDALGTPTGAFLAQLRAGETVRIELPDGAAPLPYGVDVWRQALADPELTADSVFLYFVKNVRASRLLVALHALDPPTREELEKPGNPSGESWKWLYGESLDPFSRHPEALRLREGRSVLPGGTPADPIWSSVFRAPPTGKAFLEGFYRTGGGKAAYVVETLRNLREQPQREFLFGSGAGEDVARFQRLYAAVDSGGRNFGLARRDPYDFAHLAPFLTASSARAALASGDGGEAAFPRDEAELERLAAQGPWAGSLEEAVDRLFAPPRPGGPGTPVSARRRFLYLSGLLAQRPLLADRRLAILLDRGFDRYHAAYAPLEDFPLSRPDPAIRYVFTLDRLARRAASREAELCAGLFEGYVALLAEIARGGTLAPQEPEALLEELMKLPIFAAPDVSPAAGEAALFAWLSGRLLPALDGSAETADADDRLTRALVGPASSAPFDWRGGRYRFDPAQDEVSRRKAFLSRQSLASVADLETLHRQRAALISALERGDPESAREAAAELARGLRLPEGKPSGRSVDERIDEAEQRARETAGRIGTSRQSAGAELDALDRVLAERHLEAVLGHVYASSAGDPEDLYYEDPSFVRRHSFRTVEKGGAVIRTAFTSTALDRDGSGGGYRIAGSLFGLPEVLGLMHADQLSYGPDAKVPTEEIRSKLLAPIRRMSVARLDDDSLLFLAASGRAAIEWAGKLAALSRPERFEEWSRLGRDLVPGSRLWPLASLEGQPTEAELSAFLSPTDLYRLGRRLAAEGPASRASLPSAGQAREALARLQETFGVEGARARLAQFGPYAEAYAGRLALCDVDMPPYERLASYRRPQVFAERLYDLKVAVAFRVAEAGLPAAILPVVLPAALDAMLSTLNLTHPYDWRGTVRAAAAFSRPDLDRILDDAVRSGRLMRERDSTLTSGRLDP